MKRLNLIGETFGKLKVMDFAGVKNESTMWTCECECGNIIDVKGSSLKSGEKTSCGCDIDSKRKRPRKNIIGQRFGLLTVIERAYVQNRVQYIRCKCDCGKDIVVRYPNLTSGTTTSCGCVKKKRTSNRKLKDLTGLKFGELTVIKRASDIGGKRVLWSCECSCGHSCIVSGSNLKSGNTTSCGCMKNSLAESIIVYLLESLNVSYEKEIKYPDLLSKKGNALRFDFKINLSDGDYFLLEHQGIQHYKEQAGGFGQYEREHSDKIKKEYCKEHNIKLEETKYSNDEKNQYDDIKNQLFVLLKKYNVMQDNTVPSLE